RRQAMNLIDEQHITRLQVGENRGDIGRALQHRAGGLAQAHSQLAGEDVGQGGFSQTRRSEDQHVIERLAPLSRSSDEDLELCLYGGLPDVLTEASGADSALDNLVLAASRPTADSLGFHRICYSRPALCKARRISSSVECVPGPTVFNSRVASAGRYPSATSA